MEGIRAFRQRTFASLSVRNYRLYFFGQAISMSGTWMQSVAQGLLVLKLTGSGTALGFVTALQTLPILFFGPWGGVIADRFPKRKILYGTQSAAGLLSLTMGTLVVTGAVRLWMVYLIAMALGCVKVFDNPTRQTFVREMVGKELLTNAVSLNSTEMNFARVIGPSIAGIMVATVGLGECFLVDGFSYGAVIFMLVMMAIIGTFTYEFSVVRPLFAEFTFEKGASGYAALTAAMGVGAVVGGLYTAGRRSSTPKMLVISASLFGASVLMTAFSPTLFIAVLAMVVVGFFSINFTSLGNVTLQLESSP